MEVSRPCRIPSRPKRSNGGAPYHARKPFTQALPHAAECISTSGNAGRDSRQLARLDPRVGEYAHPTEKAAVIYTYLSVCSSADVSMLPVLQLHLSFLSSTPAMAGTGQDKALLRSAGACSFMKPISSPTPTPTVISDSRLASAES